MHVPYGFPYFGGFSWFSWLSWYSWFSWIKAGWWPWVTFFDFREHTQPKKVWPWKVTLCRSNKPSPKCKFENCDYKWWPLYIVLHVTCIYMKKICKNETVMLLNDTENKLWFVFIMILFNDITFFNYSCDTKTVKRVSVNFMGICLVPVT